MKKFSFIEIVILGFSFLIIDLLCIIIDGLSIGIVSPIIQSLTLIGLNLIQLSKGDKDSLKLKKQFTKYLSQILPYIPTLTIVLLITAFSHNKKLKEQQ